jgi:hypothetical protein
MAIGYAALLDNEPEFARTMAASVQQRITFGERVSQKVRCIDETEPLATIRFSWYGLHMETTPFDLTPAQKSLLQSLSQETGKSVTALIEEALAGLQEQVRPLHGERNGDKDPQQPPLQPDADVPQPIWEVFSTTEDIPDEEWEKLPTDLATQHDHYIYGTPKRQV